MEVVVLQMLGPQRKTYTSLHLSEEISEILTVDLTQLMNESFTNI